MGDLLQAVVIVFMLFLCSLCLFAVIVIVRDIIQESGKIKRARYRAEFRARLKAVKMADLIEKTSAKPEEEVKQPAPVEDVVITDPIPEPVVVTPEVVEAEVSEDVEVPEDENAVVFSRQTLTLEERYATLSTEFKRYFDDIIRHAMAKDGVREIKTANYNDYKIGSYKVLRITIKRSDIVCEFQFLDRDFLNYANASSVKMKQSSTSIRVSEPSAVGAVKDGIDLVCTQIAEDKEYKKNLAKEKRREKRRKEREDNASASSEAKKMEETVNV